MTNTLQLDRSSDQGRARDRAREAAGRVPVRPSARVEYRSRGRLLVLGSEGRLAEVLDALPAGLPATLIVPTSEGSPRLGELCGQATYHLPVIGIEGYLGRFRLLSEPGLEDGEAGRFLAREALRGDLVLDLSEPAWITAELPPPGYFAPGVDPERLASALAELPELVGELDKPRFFAYDPDICAHGRSGLTACTRCLDACPAEAITSLGDRISVDANLCQGAGVCSSVCPTGAIRYTYPPPGDSLERLRVLLHTYAEQGGRRGRILFFDTEGGGELVQARAAELPDNCLPVEVAEIGSAGMELWLAALAYGASRVELLATERTPGSVLRELEAQLGYARAILEGMGYPGDAIELRRVGSDDEWVEGLAGAASEVAIDAARFAALDDKRSVLRLAVDHLYEQAPRTRPWVTLPTGAPFGEVWFDAERCTLCMACVAQCPGKALEAVGETPGLRFVEDNCVQCALCTRTCPEDAIAPSPRYVYDALQRRRPRLLKEEAPFCCIVCGKPFATRSMVDRMTAKLRGHPMFQGSALRRIQMCEECRVKDLYAQEQDA